MSIKLLSTTVKMLNNVNNVRDYIDFVKREINCGSYSQADATTLRRLCKIAFAASCTPYYEMLQTRNPASLRRVISAMCGPDGGMRMSYNGVIYRIANLKFTANVMSDAEIALVLEALEMTMTPVMASYSDEE